MCSAFLSVEYASNSPTDCIRTVQNHKEKNDGFCNLTQAKLTYSHTQNKCKLTYQLFIYERRDTLNAANFAQIYKKIANRWKKEKSFKKCKLKADTAIKVSK